MGATASMTQINARIDPGLKAGGDAGLEAAGYTTTQAIRALWKPASRLRGKPERLGGLLRAGEESRSGAIDGRLERIESACTLEERTYRDAGLSMPTQLPAVSGWS